MPSELHALLPKTHDVTRSAENRARENLNQIRASLPCIHDFTGRQSARKYKSVALTRKLDDIQRESRAGNETSAGVEAAPGGFCIEHSAAANNQVCVLARELAHQFNRAGNCHCYFDDWNATVRDGFSRKRSLFKRPDANRGDD